MKTTDAKNDMKTFKIIRKFGEYKITIQGTWEEFEDEYDLRSKLADRYGVDYEDVKMRFTATTGWAQEGIVKVIV